MLEWLFGKSTKKLEEETKGKELQDAIMNALKTIGTHEYKNWDNFEEKVNSVLKEFKLGATMIKQIIMALSEHDDTADYVLDKKGKQQADSNLRDSEKIPLKQDIKKYFEKEVRPYYKDAWMDRSKDRIGYEINFTQYFYKYVPPRSLDTIEAEIKAVNKKILDLLNEEL